MKGKYLFRIYVNRYDLAYRDFPQLTSEVSRDCIALRNQKPQEPNRTGSSVRHTCDMFICRYE